MVCCLTASKDDVKVKFGRCCDGHIEEAHRSFAIGEYVIAVTFWGTNL